VRERRGDVGDEQRVGLGGAALVLGVELAAEEPGVVGELDDLDELAVRRQAGDDQAGGGQRSRYFWLTS
jgi:hypothetical protein